MLDTWVKDALKYAGMSQSELARQLTEILGTEIQRATVNKMTTKRRRVTADEMVAISEITGYPVPLTANIPDRKDEHGLLDTAPVVGVVQAGHWLQPEYFELGQDEEIPFKRDERFKDAQYIAFRVSGDSFDEFVKDGGYAIGVPWSQTGMSIRGGLPVVVERVDSNSHLHENTLKMLEIADYSRDLEPPQIVLKPRSSNPKHQPILVPDPENEHAQINIVALILAYYQKTEWQ